jgi:hypothetical protein
MVVRIRDGRLRLDVLQWRVRTAHDGILDPSAVMKALARMVSPSSSRSSGMTSGGRNRLTLP